MLSLREPARRPLRRLVARVLILVLVAGLLPLDARASVADPISLTKSAFGELLAHTGSDPQPYAFTGEPLDLNTRFNYNRARWLDPGVGRFISSDTFDGWDEDPVSLHKYLYVSNHPVDAVDPTGQFENLPTALTRMSGQVTLALATLGAAIQQAFARGGGPALGPLWRAVGAAAERAFMQTVMYYQRLQPQLSIEGNFRLLNGKVVDGFVSLGRLGAFMEAKSSIPSRVGGALTRVVGQMQGALAQARASDRIVLWSFHRPAASSVDLVRRSVGPGAERIEFINGVAGLWKWITEFFGPV